MNTLITMAQARRGFERVARNTEAAASVNLTDADFMTAAEVNEIFAEAAMSFYVNNGDLFMTAAEVDEIMSEE